MMGPFLLALGILLLVVSLKGKSGEFLYQMFFSEFGQRINTAEQTFAEDVGAWFRFHVWDQLTNAIISGLPTIDVTLPGGIHIGTTPPKKQPTNANDASQGRSPS